MESKMYTYLLRILILSCFLILVKCDENKEGFDWDKAFAEEKEQYEKTAMELAQMLSINPNTQAFRPDLSQQELFGFIKDKLMEMYGNATAMGNFLENMLEQDGLSPENRAKLTDSYNTHKELTKKKDFLEQKIKDRSNNEEYMSKLLSRTAEIYTRMISKELVDIDEPCNLNYQNQRDVYLTSFSRRWFIYDKDDEKDFHSQQKSSEVIVAAMERLIQDPNLEFCRWRKLILCSKKTATCDCMENGDTTTKLGLKFDITFKRQGNNCVIPKGHICPPPDYKRGRKTPYPTDGAFVSIEDIQVPLECEKGTSCQVGSSNAECLMDNIVKAHNLNDMPSIVDIFERKFCSCKSLKNASKKSSSKVEL